MAKQGYCRLGMKQWNKEFKKWEEEKEHQDLVAEKNRRGKWDSVEQR